MLNSPEPTSHPTRNSSHPADEPPEINSQPFPPKMWRGRSIPVWLLIGLATYLFGLGSGYGLWGRTSLTGPEDLHTAEMDALAKQVNPEQGFTLPVRYGDLGPRLAEAGVFDVDQFAQVYEQAGQPLGSAQIEILKQGSSDAVVINRDNAYFLLNFFWAVGLANQNPVLDSGPIQQYGQGKIDQLASTGGWTLAQKPTREIFSSLPLIALTKEQQERLEQAAKAIYRPCCNNPTHFPDCNHGMAMLGVLEMMASQGASVEEMLDSAKYVNSFWYPQQTLEQAIYFKHTQDLEFKDVDAGMLLGPKFSSASGFQQVHQALADNGWLEQVPGGGSSCGV